MVLKGIRKWTSKNGVKCCVIHVEDEFSTMDKANSDECSGVSVEQMWIDDSIASKLSGKDIGKKVVPQCSIRGGRAYVTDIIVS